MHIDTELGWAITTTQYRGAPAAYMASARYYVSVWCTTNNVRPDRVEIYETQEGNFTILVTHIVGSQTEPAVPAPKTPTAALESSNEAEPDFAVVDTEEYRWTYVRELVSGDLIRSKTKPIGVVESVEFIPNANRYSLSIEGSEQPLIYSKNDRVKRKPR